MEYFGTATTASYDRPDNQRTLPCLMRARLSSAQPFSGLLHLNATL